MQVPPRLTGPQPETFTWLVVPAMVSDELAKSAFVISPVQVELNAIAAVVQIGSEAVSPESVSPVSVGESPDTVLVRFLLASVATRAEAVRLFTFTMFKSIGDTNDIVTEPAAAEAAI